VEGGGGCGLENYRTLCRPCHKDETAKLAARRARERRHPGQAAL
jgi:5-methylcytosine-specific restriction endonuclease McrA